MILLYVITVYFLFISIFGGSCNRIHAVIIFLASALNILFQLPEANTLEQYVYNKNVFVLWDGATAFILTMFLVFDKSAWKQALILAFAVLCHIMIVYDLTISSSWFSVFFYNFYDELIIVAGILQLTVSYDGFTRSLNNLQGLLFRWFLNHNSGGSSLPTQKTGIFKA